MANTRLEKLEELDRCKKIKYLTGARKKYPQWEDITFEKTNEVKAFHSKLRQQGYEIKAANIACKDNNLFWILFESEGCYLEQYAVIE